MNAGVTERAVLAVILGHGAHVHILADAELGDELGETPRVHEGFIRHKKEEVVLLEVVVCQVLQGMKWF